MKKKGFTLIELLGVLVVLAIIALITIPIVLGIIKRARVKSEEASIRGYADILEKAYSEWLIDNPNGTFNDFDYSNIEYKGNRVTCDNVDYINGNIELDCCYVGSDENNYYGYSHNAIKHYDVCPSKKEYHVGDTFTLKGDSYHIIADSPTNQDYVVALKDTLLTANEITAAGGTVTSGSGDDIGYMRYHTSSNVYATSDVKSVVDSWSSSKFTNSELKVVDGYSVRLLTVNDLSSNLGYVWYQQGTNAYWNKPKSTPSWVYNSQYWYWTMSPLNDSASDVWSVNGDGNLGADDVRNGSGAVRPVINVYKSKI